MVDSPSSVPKDLSGEPAAQAIASLIVGLVGLVPPLGLVLAPFALYRGRKALRMLSQSPQDRPYASLASAGAIIGAAALALNLLALLSLLAALLLSQS